MRRSNTTTLSSRRDTATIFRLIKAHRVHGWMRLGTNSMSVRTEILSSKMLCPRLTSYADGVRLHIDKASANKLPNKTLPIPGMEGQYITGLDVFHQLHCLVIPIPNTLAASQLADAVPYRTCSAKASIPSTTIPPGSSSPTARAMMM